MLLRPDAGDAPARQDLHPGGGHPAGPAGSGRVVPGSVLHPRGADHRQYGQNHLQRAPGRHPLPAVQHPQDPRQPQRRHRRAPDPPLPHAGAPGGGGRDRHGRPRPDSLPGPGRAPGRRGHHQRGRRAPGVL